MKKSVFICVHLCPIATFFKICKGSAFIRCGFCSIIPLNNWTLLSFYLISDKLRLTHYALRNTYYVITLAITNPPDSTKSL
jgi:hypothetical protein